MRKFFVLVLAATLALTMTLVSAAYADTTPQTLPLNQSWTDTELITTNDDWSGVPGIIGYRGDDMAAVGTNPQTVTADGSDTPVNVAADKTNPSAFNTGGIAEFHKTGQQPPNDTDSTVAFAANVTADAPHLVLSFDTTGQTNLRVKYTLRDIDGGANNAVQPVAMQYRVGDSGPYTNLPDGYVADATTGPTLADLTTPVSAALPADADNKPLVQVRVISTNSAGQDEWIGLDLFQVASDNPAIDLNGSEAGTGYSATYTEDSDPASIVDNAALTVNDADSPNLDSATVSITNRQDGTDESLSADTSGTPITASYNSSTGVLALNGSGTLAQYQQVLRTVRYNNTSNTPGTTARTVNFVVSDGTHNSNIATSTVAVVAVNDAPVANNDSANVNEDGTINVAVLDNDTDADGSLDPASVRVITAPQHGTATFNANGTITYTPNANYNGDDAFTYEVCDDGPSALCDTAEVSVTVSAVNDAPVAGDDTASVDEDGSTNVAVLDNDLDPDGQNELSPASVNIVDAPQNGTATVNPNGTITYTPDANYNGADSFTYEVCDNDTPALCDTATVSITVESVNDAPEANNDDADVDEDGFTNVAVLDNDNDADGQSDLDPTSVSIVTSPENGEATVNPDGTITYEPNQNFNGGDSFAYEVCDDQGLCDTAEVGVTVAAVNDAPVADDDIAEVDDDGSTDIAILFNDSDEDGQDNLDPSSVRVVSAPQDGTATANANGTITYTPDENFNGDDSFTYEVCDDAGACDTATVNVTVMSVNDAPVANDDAANVDEDDSTNITVLDNDTDPDGQNDLDPASVRVMDAPDEGVATVNANGTITYEPDANFNGSDSFVYEVCDNGDPALCDTATVNVTVAAVNDAPVVNDDRGSTAAAAAVSNAFVSQYASSAATTPTRMYKFDTTHSPYTFNQVGKNIPRPMNAIGYRSTDRMIYGYRMISSPGIMKVNPTTGAARFLGNPTGLPASKSYLAGDVSPSGSIYYLYASKSGLLRKVNLKTFQASTVKLSSGVALADLAVSPTDGKLYGVDKDGKLLRINPQTGQVTTISVTGLVPGGYGAAWFTSQGDLIVYENGASKPNGTMTWIANPTTTPRVVSTQAGPSTVGNDGAAYVASPNWAGLSVEVDVLANDSDPEGALNPNTLRVVQPPVNGTVRINADKTITYTSSSSYRGTDSFRYELCDNGAPQQCDTATVNITS